MKNFYMSVAQQCAQMSRAVRLKVGCIVVKNNNILSFSWNGTPTGWDNACEDREYCLSRDFNGNYFPGTEQEYPFEDEFGRYRLKTKPEVLHAERNCLDKMAKTGIVGAEGATMVITHSPCIECAKSIFSAGIKELVYQTDYRSPDGIYFLEKCGVKVEKIS